MSESNKEKRIAEAKGREELRNAVHLNMIREGVNRDEIRRAIKEIVNVEIERSVKHLLSHPDGYLKKIVTKIFEEVAPKSLNKEKVNKAIDKQIADMTKEFVEQNLKLSIKADGGW